MPFFGGGGGDYHIVGTNIKGGTSAAPAVVGDNNMALGNGAGQSLVNADRNVLLGNNAGNALDNDSDNIVIGTSAAAETANMASSFVSGSSALENDTGLVDSSFIHGMKYTVDGVDVPSIESSFIMALGFVNQTKNVSFQNSVFIGGINPPV